MRLVVQRVSSARVEVADKTVGAIDRPGLLVLVGVTHGDDEQVAARLADKAVSYTHLTLPTTPYV